MARAHGTRAASTALRKLDVVDVGEIALRLLRPIDACCAGATRGLLLHFVDELGANSHGRKLAAARGRDSAALSERRPHGRLGQGLLELGTLLHKEVLLVEELLGRVQLGHWLELLLALARRLTVPGLSHLLKGSRAGSSLRGTLAAFGRARPLTGGLGNARIVGLQSSGGVTRACLASSRRCVASRVLLAGAAIAQARASSALLTNGTGRGAAGVSTDRRVIVNGALLVRRLRHGRVALVASTRLRSGHGLVV